MRKYKLLSIILCMILLCFNFSACAFVDSFILEKDDGEPLMIYVWDQDEYIINHINQYNAQHDTTQIEYEAFSREYLKVMCHKIKTGIEEQKGPDLILIDYIFLQHSDIDKIAKEELFADLDKYLDKSPYFDDDSYNMKVLDAGIIGGNRILLPLSYFVPFTACSTKVAENVGVDLPAEITLDTMLYTLDKYYENTDQNSIVTMGINLEMSLFNHINENHQIDETQSLNQLIKEIKRYNKRLRSCGLYEAVKNEDFNYYDWCNEKNVLITRMGGGNTYSSFFYFYNLYKNKYNSDIVLYNYPLAVESVQSTPELSLAISSTSNKKKRAFKFIEYMLSEEIQKSDKFYGIPVNIEACEIKKDKLINGDYVFPNSPDVTINPVPSELVYKFISMIENAECEFDNYYTIYDKCFSEPINNYIYNNLQLEHVIDKINENLFRYYDEEE